ncbi:SGNH/GDSL hydrolase family protein [Actinoplanes bogorensis]|uniref:SGNH/GDSL hydrolase family protein n=1 Tax=Paractinoplanes bogorensis TaxID=1610840 RepID=A0ABS5YMI5_9ACTN|nr:SGNH/GDSL hydrolase family protein [Actinoplanes bogorensis]MBU2663964.1 SGNH/GDSL hydrolase family protein [Actinoplanes bogorensis]
MAFRARAIRTTVVGAVALAVVIAAPIVYRQNTATAAAQPAAAAVAPAAVAPAVVVPVQAAAVTAPGRLLDRLATTPKKTTITLLGDSTGNEQKEWFYQLSTWISARNPSYRATYRLWNSTKQAYGPSVLLRAGTGGPELVFYNGSVPSTRADYATDTKRFAKMTAQGGDLYLVSYSHNENAATTYPAYATLVNRLAAKPTRPVVLPVLQNPEGAPGKTSLQRYAHVKRLGIIEKLAKDKGWSTVDAYRAFTADKRALKTLVPDGVHPNAAGQAVWLSAAQKAFLR